MFLLFPVLVVVQHNMNDCLLQIVFVVESPAPFSRLRLSEERESLCCSFLQNDVTRRVESKKKIVLFTF